MSQVDRIENAAEDILDAARIAGMAAGVAEQAAALMVLQQAYAKAIADAVNFGDDPTRLMFAVQTVRDRLLEDVQIQVTLRKHGRFRING